MLKIFWRAKLGTLSVVCSCSPKDILSQILISCCLTGIPFRRGYLLYGAPGSGKTSMIHSLAGELGLDVYVISLSRTGLDDTALSELISDLPERCIALMEDIDAAFHQGIESRDLNDSATTPPPPPPPPDGQAQSQGQSPGGNGGNGGNGGPRSSASRITLSGLLNAIDGIGAHDGRILYATTNKYFALDPALCRPGRMDLHIEFKLASRYQARELFRCFYMPGDDTGVDGEGEEEVSEKADILDSGYSSPRAGTPERDIIELTPTDEKIELLPDVASSKKTTIQPLIYAGNSHRNRAPQLTRRQVSDLATEFAASIPEREHSMAALQGYLMAYKTRPYEAVKEAAGWVEKERADKAEKLKARGGFGTQVKTEVPTEAKAAETVAAVAVH